MRRWFSGLLVTLALTCASFALSAHVASLIALDPGRPARVAAAMLETEQGKEIAADALSGQLRAVVPGMDQARADALAYQVAHDPELRQALEDSASDGGPYAGASAVVDAVARANPRLGRVAHRQLDRQVSHSGAAAGPVGALMPNMLGSGAGELRARAREIARDAFGLALLFAAVGLLVGPGRDRLLRRIGRWQVGAAVVGLLVWLAVPDLVLPHLDGRWPVVVAAGLRAAGAGLGLTFGLLATAGVVTWLVAGAAGFLSPVGHERDVPVGIRAEARRNAARRRQQLRDRLASSRTRPQSDRTVGDARSDESAGYGRGFDPTSFDPAP